MVVRAAIPPELFTNWVNRSFLVMRSCTHQVSHQQFFSWLFGPFMIFEARWLVKWVSSIFSSISHRLRCCTWGAKKKNSSCAGIEPCTKFLFFRPKISDLVHAPNHASSLMENVCFLLVSYVEIPEPQIYMVFAIWKFSSKNVAKFKTKKCNLSCRYPKNVILALARAPVLGNTLLSIGTFKSS